MTDRQMDTDRFIAEYGEGPVLRALLAAYQDHTIVTDVRQRIVGWSTGVEAISGHPAADALGRDLHEFLAPAAPSPLPEAQEGVSAHAGRVLVLRHRDGRPVPIPCTVVVAPATSGGALYLLQPVAAVAGALPMGDPEQVSLLATINHRMRNNLATICALLEMEVLQAPENERDRLAVSLARIRSLSLAHNLFVDDPAHQVDVGGLVRAIVESAVATFARPGDRIAVQCTPVRALCARRTTYLALALTELAIYLARGTQAGADAAIGSVAVSEEQDDLVIVVQSHADAPATPLNPLSRQILTGLVERSLRGTVTLATDAPFSATLRCPIEAPAASPATAPSA